MKYSGTTNIFIFLTAVLITIPSISFSQNETIISLKNPDETYTDFTREELIEHLCNHEWSYGYDRMDFEKNGIYITGAQDSYEGKWELTKDGKIKVYSAWDGGKTRFLMFSYSYILLNSDNRRDAYYSDAYYEAFNDSKERKREQEIELSDVTVDDILGIWVTDEQGPMGELIGFKFYEHTVYMGNPGLEMLFGCWDDVEYENGYNWTYNKENWTIIIESDNEEGYSDNIIIQIKEFYKEAFIGSISPDFILDEITGEDIRDFWKSNCDKVWGYE